jgi:serine protease Do
MRSLISDWKVTRGWLGVAIQNLDERMAQSFNYPSSEGALIGQVDPNGPSKKAGLQQGDIVVQIENEKIKNVTQLRNYVAAIKPGTSVEVSVVRDGRKMTVTVTIGELSGQGGGETEESRGLNEDLGLSVEEFDENSQRRPRTSRTKGLVVTEIDPQGLAARSGLQPGDIIASVNGKRVDTVAAFRSEIESGDSKKGLRLVVESQGMERFVLLSEESAEDAQ